MIFICGRARDSFTIGTKGVEVMPRKLGVERNESRTPGHKDIIDSRCMTI